jgi:Mannosyl-glycoprotein endo-beta-N-acetylglucosaminidase
MKYALPSILLTVAILLLSACADTISSYIVISSPTITASKIDSILCTANSPACGTGRQLYDLGVQYGINPTIALAFFKHESSYGMYGEARVTRSLGNIRCSDGYACIDGFRAYPSWSSGYRDWYQLIKYYCDKLGKCTLDTIIPTYAPSSENDEIAYITDIKQSVDSYTKNN